MIFTLAFYTNPIKRKQTLTESERNEDHEMEKISNIGPVSYTHLMHMSLLLMEQILELSQ